MPFTFRGRSGSHAVVPPKGACGKLQASCEHPSLIVSVEPELGPNTDLLGTSPKASLGQYPCWRHEGGSWEYSSGLLLPGCADLNGLATVGDPCCGGGPRWASMQGLGSEEASGGWTPAPCTGEQRQSLLVCRFMKQSSSDQLRPRGGTISGLSFNLSCFCS